MTIAMAAALTACGHRASTDSGVDADSVSIDSTAVANETALLKTDSIGIELTDTMVEVRVSVDWPVAGNDTLLQGIRQYILKQLGIKKCTDIKAEIKKVAKTQYHELKTQWQEDRECRGEDMGMIYSSYQRISVDEESRLEIGKTLDALLLQRSVEIVFYNLAESSKFGRIIEKSFSDNVAQRFGASLFKLTKVDTEEVCGLFIGVADLQLGKRFGCLLIGSSHTLEEAANADVILHIVDASNEDCSRQARVTLELLKELGCEGIPVVTVLNKCDLVPYIDELASGENTVKISARKGEGIPAMLEAVAAALPASAVKMKLLIPYYEGGLLNEIRYEGKVFSEKYTNEGTLIDALVDMKLYSKVERYKHPEV